LREGKGRFLVFRKGSSSTKIGMGRYREEGENVLSLYRRGGGTYSLSDLRGGEGPEFHRQGRKVENLLHG